MSFLRRVANLARGTFKVSARDWSAPAEKDEPAAAPGKTPVSRAAAPGPAPADPPRPPPERDENGDVKRTL